jgi:putative serine/threonine protein kinase
LPENEIPLHGLLQSRYSHILTYPGTDPEETKARIVELSEIGISALRFQGVTQIGGVPVLGKGCVGIVTQARLEGNLVALKIRRLDADRPSMNDEARLLRLANSVNVGPRLISATKNFLTMDLFRGAPLFRWAEGSRAGGRVVRKLVTRLLTCCFMLDSIGLDHGELSHAPKNVLVNRFGQACIVDFESASTARRVANVTSLLQYFLFGRVSKTLHASQIFPDKRNIVKALGEYKREGSVENFQGVLGALGCYERFL